MKRFEEWCFDFHMQKLKTARNERTLKIALEEGWKAADMIREHQRANNK